MGRALKRPTKRVSEDERKIGLRLAYLRGCSNMRQSDLAARLGLTRAQLSTIEAGRVALRFQTGWNVCKLFDIYPGWLDTGHWPLGGERPFPPLDHRWMAWVERMVAANKNTLFSQGWPEVGWLFGPDAPEIGPSGGSIAKPTAEADTPCSPAGALRGRARMVTAFERENTTLEDAETREKNMLTEAATCAKLPPVKSQLDNLLAKLDRLIKVPGNKTKLADFLDAPLASVSRWLSGKREPGREITLKMLRWVEQLERQTNKSPGSATTPPEPKTQSKASNEKKPKSSPQER